MENYRVCWQDPASDVSAGAYADIPAPSPQQAMWQAAARAPHPSLFTGVFPLGSPDTPNTITGPFNITLPVPGVDS